MNVATKKIGKDSIKSSSRKGFIKGRGREKEREDKSILDFSFKKGEELTIEDCSVSGVSIAKVKLSLASKEDILSWSHGAVTESETVSYRNFQPISGGLHGEDIFGTRKNWSCSCGKYTTQKYAGVRCPSCGVEVTSSSVRRERMAHIPLEKPVVHCWYYRYSDILASLLGQSQDNIANVVLHQKFIVVTKGSSSYADYEVIQVDLPADKKEKLGLETGIGAEGIKRCLEKLDLKKKKEALLNQLASLPKNSTRRKGIFKVLKYVNKFLRSGINPVNMVIEVLPVCPAALRPIILLPGGIAGVNDLNNLLRNVINRNSKLASYISLNVPIELQYEAANALQFSVDNYFENSRSAFPLGTKTKHFKSLADRLKGKEGEFRKNLLGKRVDYSGRSVLIVGSDLKMNQIGIPKTMALELCKIFVIRHLITDDMAKNMNGAEKLIDKLDDSIWPVLKKAIIGKKFIFNRQPSLHRISMLAFDGVIIEGKAIMIHPLACGALNADFDGDQGAIHLVLTNEGQIEAALLLYFLENIFSPASGKLIAGPVREIMMACYYVSIIDEAYNGKERIFYSTRDVEGAFENKVIFLNEPIRLIYKGREVRTTIGRVLINNFLPEEFRNYEIIFSRGMFHELAYKIYKKYGFGRVAELLDAIKDFGFEYAYLAGLTISLSKMVIPKGREELTKKCLNEISEVEQDFKKGKIVSTERDYMKVIKVSELVNKISQGMLEEFHPLNPLYVMMQSGARGNLQQFRQLSGAKGLVRDAEGRIVTRGITSSFRDGFSPIEAYTVLPGGRKGSADKSLRTAPVGYWYRRLVMSSHGIVIEIEDCYTESFTLIEERNIRHIVGRTLAEDLNITGLSLTKGEMIEPDHLKIIKEALARKEITGVKIRTVFDCKVESGVCAACYGMDLSKWKRVQVGEPCGLIASQSIAEPGMQFTMRTFHVGAVAEGKTAEIKIFSDRAGRIRIEAEIFYDRRSSTYYLPFGGRIFVEEKEYLAEDYSILAVKDGEKVEVNQLLFSKNTDIKFSCAFHSGILKYPEDLTQREERSEHVERKAIKDFDLRIVDKTAQTVQSTLIPMNSIIIFNHGELVEKGAILSKSVNFFESAEITGDLQRIQNILELRENQDYAVISKQDAKLSIAIDTKKNIYTVNFLDQSSDLRVLDKILIKKKSLIVKDGDIVKKGDKLTKGSINFSEYLHLFGLKLTREAILAAVEQIYVDNGITVDRKHFEIIIKKLSNFVVITSEEDSEELTVGEVVSLRQFMDEVRALNKIGKKGPEADNVLRSLTKASLYSESVISSASFQEASKVLTHAIIGGAEDNLRGIEESIIFGTSIPVGTGFNFEKDNIIE